MTHPQNTAKDLRSLLKRFEQKRVAGAKTTPQAQPDTDLQAEVEQLRREIELLQRHEHRLKEAAKSYKVLQDVLYWLRANTLESFSFGEDELTVRRVRRGS